MKHLATPRLVDVLAEWGRHEATGRFCKRPDLAGLSFDGPDGAVNALEVALRLRAPMVSLILSAELRGCSTVEFSPDDVPAMRTYDGRPIDEYAAALLKQRNASGDHARRLAGSPDRISGPLVCATQASDGLEVISPVIVYDGCHRLAAWLEQLRTRPAYPIRAHLIVLRSQVTIFKPTA